MAESEAVDAMLSRLSFTASLKAEQIVKDTAMKFSIITVMKISLIFCLLVSLKKKKKLLEYVRVN